jgi:hypothetical protein
MKCPYCDETITPDDALLCGECATEICKKCAENHDGKSLCTDCFEDAIEDEDDDEYDDEDDDEDDEDDDEVD